MDSTPKYIPHISDPVVVLNATGAGSEAPGLVSRVWGQRCVNIALFPDGGTPTTRTSVPLYANRQQAQEYLNGMPGHAPTVAFYPPTFEEQEEAAAANTRL